jgi:DNA topoisomerase-1
MAWLCSRFGLNYVDSLALALRRRRAARAFAYYDKQGATVRNKALRARIRQLAIPSAWIEVCIAEEEHAHIQAIGRDDEDRLQYRYHPEWEKARDTAKE